MRVNLRDTSFKHQNSATLGCENAEEHPRHFTWDREGYEAGNTFITDMHIKEARHGNIGWLIEPPSLHDNHYITSYNYKDAFSVILTFLKQYLDLGDPYAFYPLGGSWIPQEDWGLHAKTKALSIIGTQKQRAEGHQMRHRAIKMLGDKADVWGRGYRPIGSKTKALKDYRFTVVIESCRENYYFSEKLIDAISMGCVPIYWGCPSIGDFFNADGIMQFYDLNELDIILSGLTEADYTKRLPVLKENLELCELYRCAEDWIWKAYPELFERSWGVPPF